MKAKLDNRNLTLHAKSPAEAQKLATWMLGARTLGIKLVDGKVVAGADGRPAETIVDLKLNEKSLLTAHKKAKK